MTNHNATDTNQGCGYWELINAHEEALYDTASSVSRQHYIDTGRYMTHAEVAEWATEPHELGPDPLIVSPISPELLAAAFLAEIRLDPLFVQGVATCPRHEMFTIVDEVIDAAHEAGLVTDAHDPDRVWIAAEAAAYFAREICRFELGYTDGII